MNPKEPQPTPQRPPVKLDDIRKAAEIVTAVLLELKAMTKPDMQLDLLGEMASRRIIEMGGEPILKGYLPTWAKDPFPSSICISVDYEICHGIPNKRMLQEGQIVTYDVAVRYKTACGDAALTVPVGSVDNFKQRLLRHGVEALNEGVKQVKAGQKISAIGKAIEDYCLKKNYEIIKDFSGHHIGSELHEEPHIPNFYNAKYDDVFLKEGDVICIEPMITRAGYSGVGIAEDGWTSYQVKGQPVVQFEHMVLVKKDGYELLTGHISFDNK